MEFLQLRECPVSTRLSKSLSELVERILTSTGSGSGSTFFFFFVAFFTGTAFLTGAAFALAFLTGSGATSSESSSISTTFVVAFSTAATPFLVFAFFLGGSSSSADRSESEIAVVLDFFALATFLAGALALEVEATGAAGSAASGSDSTTVDLRLDARVVRELEVVASEAPALRSVNTSWRSVCCEAARLPGRTHLEACFVV